MQGQAVGMQGSSGMRAHAERLGHRDGADGAPSIALADGAFERQLGLAVQSSIAPATPTSASIGRPLVPQALEPLPYMRSGALTPSRSKPFAIVCRDAAHSHSRATWIGASSSSPRGRTQQTS